MTHGVQGWVAACRFRRGLQDRDQALCAVARSLPVPLAARRWPMTLRFPLRWKILVLTVLPLVGLVFMTLWTVKRNITRQVNANTHDDLRQDTPLIADIPSTPSC